SRRALPQRYEYRRCRSGEARCNDARVPRLPAAHPQYFREEGAEPMTDKKFAVVSAVYNDSRYLDDFLVTLDHQTFDHSLIVIILFDDGSTDGSLDRMNEWAAATDFAVTVLTKVNGGQASARNVGLDSVTAEWVTFTDPDDTLAEDYFETVEASLGSHGNA